jgi:hypothetical protein
MTCGSRMESIVLVDQRDRRRIDESSIVRLSSVCHEGNDRVGDKVGNRSSALFSTNRERYPRFTLAARRNTSDLLLKKVMMSWVSFLC